MRLCCDGLNLGSWAGVAFPSLFLEHDEGMRANQDCQKHKQTKPKATFAFISTQASLLHHFLDHGPSIKLLHSFPRESSLRGTANPLSPAHTKRYHLFYPLASWFKGPRRQICSSNFTFAAEAGYQKASLHSCTIFCRLLPNDSSFFVTTSVSLFHYYFLSFSNFMGRYCLPLSVTNAGSPEKLQVSCLFLHLLSALEKDLCQLHFRTSTSSRQGYRNSHCGIRRLQGLFVLAIPRYEFSWTSSFCYQYIWTNLFFINVGTAGVRFSAIP